MNQFLVVITLQVLQLIMKNIKNPMYCVPMVIIQEMNGEMDQEFEHKVAHELIENRFLKMNNNLSPRPPKKQPTKPHSLTLRSF